MQNSSQKVALIAGANKGPSALPCCRTMAVPTPAATASYPGNSNGAQVAFEGAA
jgi:hypothetical protein